jgi:uncharacterized membrane protein YvbJ
MWNCNHCESSNDESANICKVCGNTRNANFNHRAQDAKTNSLQKTKTGIPVYAVLIILALSIICIILNLTLLGSFKKYQKAATSPIAITAYLTTFTSLPPTPSPTVENQIVLTLTSTQVTANTLSPDKFIRWYFDAVWQDRNYEYLWTLSTPSFQSIVNPGGYQEYVKWWESVKQVDLNSVAIVPKGTDYVIATVNVNFYLKNGRVLSNKEYTYQLTYSSEIDSWLFDIR